MGCQPGVAEGTDIAGAARSKAVGGAAEGMLVARSCAEATGFGMVGAQCSPVAPLQEILCQ